MEKFLGFDTLCYFPCHLVWSGGLNF